MRQDNILQKLSMPQLSDTVAASSVRESHVQPDHAQANRKNCEWKGVLRFVLKDTAAELW